MRVSSFDGSIFGYGDIAGPYTPALEFTAQAAAAGIKDADFVMQQIDSLQIRCNDNYGQSHPGALPGAADHWYGGPLTPWNTTMCGVSPTAWVYFAQNGDPLLDLFPHSRDFNGDGRSDILWRHTSGGLYIWLLNGTSVIGTGSPGGAGIDWQIQ